MLGKTNNLLGPHANWVVNEARSFGRLGSGFRLFIEIYFSFESQVPPKYET